MEYVSIIRCDDYDEEKVYRAVEESVDHLGGWKRFVKPGNKVVLKPNLLMFKKPEEAATTHPSVVKAVTEQVQKAGGVVTIAESPGGPYHEAMLRRVYKATGIEETADETGAILNYDLRVVEIQQPEAKYLKLMEVLKPLVDADVIINLPKLKTHTMMTYTGAVKNMFGAMAGTAKADLHLRMPDYVKFADSLIDIFLGVKPTLNLMDAVYGMEGYGPTNGSSRHIGLILASTDGFALDATALKVIQLPVEKVPVMKNAIERGFLDEDIKILGEQIENVTVSDFNIPLLNDAERIERFNHGFFRLGRRWIRPRPQIQNEKCVMCGNCVKNCPPGVITMEKGKKPVIDYKNCIRCFCCHELCMHDAITIHRNMLSRFMLNSSLAGRNKNNR